MDSKLLKQLTVLSMLASAPMINDAQTQTKTTQKVYPKRKAKLASTPLIRGAPPSQTKISLRGFSRHNPYKGFTTVSQEFTARVHWEVPTSTKPAPKYPFDPVSNKIEQEERMDTWKNHYYSLYKPLMDNNKKKKWHSYGWYSAGAILLRARICFYDKFLKIDPLFPGIAMDENLAPNTPGGRRFMLEVMVFGQPLSELKDKSFKHIHAEAYFEKFANEDLKDAEKMTRFSGINKDHISRWFSYKLMATSEHLSKETREKAQKVATWEETCNETYLGRGNYASILAQNLGNFGFNDLYQYADVGFSLDHMFYKGGGCPTLNANKKITDKTEWGKEACAFVTAISIESKNFAATHARNNFKDLYPKSKEKSPSKILLQSRPPQKYSNLKRER